MPKKLWLLPVMLCILILASPAAGQAQTSPPKPTAAFEPAPCMFKFPVFSFVPPNLFGFKCGYVTVPLRHDDPTGPTIRLAVAVLPGTNPNPAPDPLFVAQGGPGGSSLELFPLMMLGSSLRTDRDIVIFDQRGTLYSEPNLLCPELDRLAQETIELDLSDEEAENRSLAAYQACGERLREAGVNLAAFNSLENAADVDSVRQALGYDKINFYGVSYGTLLGQHYLRLYPASLRSLILDAVVPTQGSFIAAAAQTANRAFKEMANLCASDTACNAAYPNLEATIYEVMTALNETPATVPVTNPDTGHTYQAVVNGDMFLNAVFLAMYEPSLISALPALVFNTRAGDYHLLSTLLPLAIFQPTFSAGMYQTVVCAEEANFDPAQMPLAGVPPQLAEMMQKGNVNLIKTCRLWKIPSLGPEVDQPVTSSVPTLLLSGRFDPITPATNAATVVQTLKNGYAYTFPNTSHGAFFSSQCASQMVEDFLNNPTSAPVSGCLADQPTTFDMVTPDKVLMTPAMDILNGRRLNGLDWLIVSLLILGSFFLVWPLAWIIRQIWQRPVSAKQPGCLIGWGGPLLVFFTTGLTLVFLISLIVLAVATDPGWLMAGIPRGAAPLFTLPFFLFLLALAMLLVSLAVWLRGYWAIWRRLYYSALTLAALGVIAVLFKWGMFTVFW